MRIKCVVKNVMIFDLIFDADQKKKENPIFRAVALERISFCGRSERPKNIDTDFFSGSFSGRTLKAALQG